MGPGILGPCLQSQRSHSEKGSRDPQEAHRLTSLTYGAVEQETLSQTRQKVRTEMSSDLSVGAMCSGKHLQHACLYTHQHADF